VLFQSQDAERQLNKSEHGSHMKIIKRVGYGKRVLDVGTATGCLSKELKKNDCYVVGIEIDQDSAKIARLHCDEVIIGDVENMIELPYEDAFFDAVVCADVLEHLKRPDLLIANLRRYLKVDGFIVASVPNVARLDARLKHLFGKFDYTESGIFDKTHLRFFTLQTAKRLFEGAGYRVVKVDYSGIASRVRLLSSLLAFQFIIVAKPR